MTALKTIHEDALRKALSGQPYSPSGASVLWRHIRDRIGVSYRCDSGLWLMWLETVAWVIQNRPDLIPEDSPLNKALAARGVECGRYERIGRAAARAISEELR